MNTTITKELLDNYLKGKCTISESELVEQWYASFETAQPLFENNVSFDALDFQMESKEVIDAMIAVSENASLIESTDVNGMIEDVGVIRMDARRTFFTWQKAAAAIIIILGASLGMHFGSHSRQGVVTRSSKNERIQTKEIVPGGSKAVLTLADGSTIVLDSMGSGTLALQGDTKVIKLANGQLVYDTSHSEHHHQTVGYNTLATPRAAQYQVVLPDGTKVWLNAASSIKYPTAFVGLERVVEITGEVYFEVAKISVFNSKNGSVKKAAPVPFRVKVRDMEVEVLGTHFNVNAYHEEQTINTTLLEGSVILSNGNKQVLIKPGERAKLNASGAFKIENADVNEVIAWKNGLFQFENASLNTVMRQIARWYDVEVVYERDVSADRFQGKLFRNTDINQLLKILELSGAEFKIEGKKIIVQ